jgi:hypothetical protein
MWCGEPLLNLNYSHGVSDGRNTFFFSHDARIIGPTLANSSRPHARPHASGKNWFSPSQGKGLRALIGFFFHFHFQTLQGKEGKKKKRIGSF